MKYLIIIFIGLFLNGCSGMTPEETGKAVQVCEKYGLRGVIIGSMADTTIGVVCREDKEASNE